MGSNLANQLSQLINQVTEQAWFQQLKSKWEEIDLQSRTYIQIAAAGILGVGLLVFVASSLLSVRALKKELADKNDLILLIRTAGEELRTLKASGSSAAGASDSSPWNTYFDGSADRAGMDHTKMTVSEEKVVEDKKSKDKSPDQTKESLMDLNLKKVNIKQLVRFAFNIENGPRPVKLRNLVIETQPDQSGYLDATLSVSAFTLSKQ